MPESNIVQAWVPDNCEVLFNEAGTAPGMLFRNKGQIIISLPGVPNEMEHIMEKNVLQILKDNFDTPDYIHKTLITSGEGESFIAERLRDFERALPENIKLAYLPNINIVKLRLTANDVPTAILDAQFEKLKNLLANIYVIDSDLELEEVIALLLKKNKKTVSVAESCTGGNISSRITSVTGASAFFKGGVVPYTIEIKESVLGVDPGIIAQHTVVSRETVIDMAEKCLHKFGSDYALSVSGYLEKNDHGNVVWIGWSNGIQSGAKKIVAPYDRKKNTQFVSNTALNMLRLFIIENP